MRQEIAYGLVAQLGERTVRIREVRGFDPLRVHQKGRHPQGCLPFWYPMDDRIIIESPGGAFIDQCAQLVDSKIGKADADDHPSSPLLVLCTDYVLTFLLF